jgi:AmmeMemoRadiSam system protein B/AmmeMemoRadiSam system protein A
LQQRTDGSRVEATAYVAEESNVSDHGFRSAGVRPAAVAGSWYPEEPGHLTSQVEVMLEAARPWTREAALRAVVVPHAAIRYSGPTAAHAYIALRPEQHRRVVVLAPNHRVALNGAAVDPSSHYQTPLGRMAVDLEAVEQLAAQPDFWCSTEPFEQEHAIEMQLPFLQHRLPDARLVPVIIGDVQGEDSDRIAASLAPLLDGSTLVVVSSDFMHYGSNFGYVPFNEDVAGKIRDYDAQAIDAITRGSFDDFQSVLKRTNNTICGRKPIGVLLQLMPRTWKGELRSYTNSGEITGDYGHSVSYAALAFSEGDDEPKRLAAAAERMIRDADRIVAGEARSASAPDWGGSATLSLADRRTLLRLARQSIEAAVRDGPEPQRPVVGEPPAAFSAPAAVFVSLHRRRGGRLRGCVGWLEARRSLVEAVIENAEAAALRDPRFDPVEAEELPDLEIEISVLGPMIDVDDFEAIQVGRDGLLIDKEEKRGVLLPQVPVQLRWNREQFLENLCRKADLPAGAWRSGARIRRFAAEVFSEAELGEAGELGAEQGSAPS